MQVSCHRRFLPSHPDFAPGRRGRLLRGPDRLRLADAIGALFARTLGGLVQRRTATQNSLDLPSGFPSFAGMKHYRSCLVLVLVLAGWLGLTAAAAAQNAAATAAAQEEAEARYRSLASQVAGLKEAQDLHSQQIAALEKSLRELSEQVVRAANQTATQEKLGQLAEQIRRVDEARVAENKKIFETIDELHRILKNMAAAPPPRPLPAPTTTTPPAASTTASEDMFEYVVQKNDTLDRIVQAYRSQGFKVSYKAVREANPKVNWDRLRIGQKIYIPKPH